MSSKKELGGGSVLDIGIYAINFLIWAMGEAPEQVQAMGEINDQVRLLYKGTSVYDGTNTHRNTGNYTNTLKL